MLGSNPNKGGGGVEHRRKGLEIGGVGCRGQFQGGGGDTLMITRGADKCPPDPIFYLFEWYFSTFF